jgi:hypothetical protein
MKVDAVKHGVLLQLLHGCSLLLYAPDAKLAMPPISFFPPHPEQLNDSIVLQT